MFNYIEEGEREQEAADLAEDIDMNMESDFDSDEEEIFQDDEVEGNEETESDEDELIDVDDETGDESEETQEVAEPVEPEGNVKQKQSDVDNSKFAAARREAETQLLQIKQEQDNFAKELGWNSFEEMKEAQKVQRYVDQGYDENTAKQLLEREELKQRMARLEAENRIKVEKSQIQSRPFFKELEPEIDAILAVNPDIPVKMLYNERLGERFEELMEQKTKETKQKTLNSVKSKSHLKPDNKGASNVKSNSVSEDEYKMYCKLSGKPVSKADYAKWKSENG